MIRRCPACDRPNRVRPRHLADRGRCGSCKAPLPLVSEPIDADEATFDEVVLKVDTERSPAVAARYGVQSIPNFVVLKDGRGGPVRLTASRYSSSGRCEAANTGR